MTRETATWDSQASGSAQKRPAGRRDDLIAQDWLYDMQGVGMRLREVLCFIIAYRNNKMYDQERIRKKSVILTNHLNTRSSSLPTLPTLPSLELPKPDPSKQPKQPKPFKVYSIKTREQLLKEDRFRNLLKLKINLNDLHIQELEFKEKMRPKKERDANLAERMEVRLNQIMATEPQPSAEKQMERDLEEIDFLQCCDSLLRICAVIRKEGNLHFKTKITNFAYSMKNQPELLQLFQKLLDEIPIAKLYKRYRKAFRETPYFRKELMALAIQGKHIVETYQKSRYQFLNAGIVKRTKEMAVEGKEIGDRLNQVQNWKMRKGLYRSLQKMQFQCMANRNVYEELTERVKALQY